MKLEFFDELIKEYDSSKYPEDIYNNLIFEINNKGLSDEKLKEAILWKYGKYSQLIQNKNYPKRYNEVILNYSKILHKLNDIFQSEIPREIKIDKLKNILTESNNRIVTNAWIAHLYFPDVCRIIDQHNFRAMRYLTHDKPLNDFQKKQLVSIKPTTWDDLREYERFFRELKSQNPEIDDRSLDKYLMVYGQKLKKQIKIDINFTDSSVQKHVYSSKEMKGKPLNTWGGRSSFTYLGSVDEGTKIFYGSNNTYAMISSLDYEDLLEHFSNKIVSCGTSRTKPPSGSLGEWLQEHVSKIALASYVGSILIEEGFAKKRGSNIEFF